MSRKPTKPSGKKDGAIGRGEKNELHEIAKRIAKKSRKTERLVWVTARTATALKGDETEEECRVRYRLKHRGDYGLGVI